MLTDRWSACSLARGFALIPSVSHGLRVLCVCVCVSGADWGQKVSLDFLAQSNPP